MGENEMSHASARVCINVLGVPGPILVWNTWKDLKNVTREGRKNSLDPGISQPSIGCGCKSMSLRNIPTHESQGVFSSSYQDDSLEPRGGA